MTKDRLAERAIEAMKEYTLLSDQLWERLITNEVPKENTSLLIGLSQPYTKLKRLMDEGVTCPILRRMKKEDLQHHVESIELNVEKIKEILSQ